MRWTNSLGLAVFGIGAVAASACGDTVLESPTGAATTATAAGGSGSAAGGSDSGGDGGGASTTSSMGGNGAGGHTAASCLANHNYPVPADYDQFGPVMGSHCKGTNHQDIENVEKLVFLGDSITQGTPPTPGSGFYRTVLADRLTAKFPGLEVVECAENGARMDDMQAQLDQCFPGVEPKRTLVVMTMGGNDIANWAKNKLPPDQAMANADVVANLLRDAIGTLKDTTKFPAGAFLVYSNVYEYTDSTGELDSCPLASVAGFSGTWLEGALALRYLEELMMEVAVDTSTDMILMGEEFCGHGYRPDTMNTCYVGPNAETWFDLSCIHPTPVGHGVIADMFEAVVDE
jgi:lysophospholipase L1-like esterase